MKNEQMKKNKKVRIKFSGLVALLVCVLVVVFCVHSILNKPIKNIYILGNKVVSDNTIITTSNIKNYPPIYKLNTKKIKKELLQQPIIKSVEIKRNIFGKLTIKIEEEKVLFLNKGTNKLVLTNNKEIDNNYNYTKIPMLINYVPDSIYEKLVTGLNNIDYDIVTSISEIEYSPSYNSKKELIDDTRFYLRMNDGNAVIMNVVNIKRLNSYNSVFASVGDERGTFHLDSILDESIYFKTFELEKQEQEQQNEESDGEQTDNQN